MGAPCRSGPGHAHLTARPRRRRHRRLRRSPGHRWAHQRGPAAREPGRHLCATLSRGSMLMPPPPLAPWAPKAGRTDAALCWTRVAQACTAGSSTVPPLPAALLTMESACTHSPWLVWGSKLCAEMPTVLPAGHAGGVMVSIHPLLMAMAAASRRACWRRSGGGGTRRDPGNRSCAHQPWTLQTVVKSSLPCRPPACKRTQQQEESGQSQSVHGPQVVVCACHTELVNLDN